MSTIDSPVPAAHEFATSPSASSTSFGFADDLGPPAPNAHSPYWLDPHAIVLFSEHATVCVAPHAMLRMVQPEISISGFGYMMLSPVALGLPNTYNCPPNAVMRLNV